MENFRRQMDNPSGPFRGSHGLPIPSDESMIFRYRQLIVLVVIVCMSSALSQSGTLTGERVETRISSRRMGNHDWYALIVKNQSGRPIAFQFLPDLAFLHFTCEAGRIFPMTAWQQRAGKGKWKPRQTEISAVNTSRKRTVHATTFLLKPGERVCAGWWVVDEKQFKTGDKARLSVCTAFDDRSRCFTSEAFLIFLGGK